jgi:N-methylhydantoinase A
MSLHAQLRVAVDTGGTFTDTVLLAGSDSVPATAKTLTTHDNLTTGALEGVRRVIGEAGVTLAEVAGFIHGTTLATNALIERRGAVVSSITTGGFRDILEIAYERRHTQYDINIEKPDLIVPRARSFTVPERISARGEVVDPLDDTALDGLISALEASDTSAVAICLLHAYANPAHELRLRDLLAARRPDLAISLSCEVSPEAREFDRLCTTIANAYVQPLMSSYLEDLARTLAAEGLACPVLMMTAGGGMANLEAAAKFPIRLVESGPAGGAILAARIAASISANRLLSFDMGGTTAKLCLIDDYQPQTARRFEISRANRFIKRSGMPVRIPVVEMIEIGAGGGSIAGVDWLGRLTVGPLSAGSEPGPAAFAKGGLQATVTDSDVALGLIDPDRFAEGRLRIDREAAEAALVRDVGQPLDLDAVHAAEGVSQIVDENMASAARMHAVESGKDLGARTMIAFGGNGPLHATRVARRAGVKRILIPRDPGVGSAIGFLFAPVSFEIVQSRYTTLEGMAVEGINALFSHLIATAEEVVRAGATSDELINQRKAFMRYRGQGHEIEVDLPDRALSHEDLETLRLAFETEYRRQFARSVPGMMIEILNWSVRVSTLEDTPPALTQPARTKSVEASAKREILCDRTGDAVMAGLFDRSQLQPGDQLSGPALIIEPQTTTLVSADFAAEVLADGSLLLTRIDIEEAAE